MPLRPVVHHAAGLMTMPKSITEQEYLERLSGLYEKIQARTPSGDLTEIFERYRDAEFDLTVDYQLGTEFPNERRKVLRTIHLKVLQDAEELKTRFTANTLTRESFTKDMQTLTQNMAQQYSSVLSPDEMAAFLGNDEKTLSLPIMPEAL